jgi:hypothetical protein
MGDDPAFVWDRPRPAPRTLPPAPPPTAGGPAGDEAAAPSPPEGAILVPLDQWTRILNQLGNLHEAGQALADARERAAKAETESTFLRERLKEMRARLDEVERAASEPPPPIEPAAPFTEWFLRRQLDRRRRGAGG